MSEMGAFVFQHENLVPTGTVEPHSPAWLWLEEKYGTREVTRAVQALRDHGDCSPRAVDLVLSVMQAPACDAWMVLARHIGPVPAAVKLALVDLTGLRGW